MTQLNQWLLLIRNSSSQTNFLGAGCCNFQGIVACSTFFFQTYLADLVTEVFFYDVRGHGFPNTHHTETDRAKLHRLCEIISLYNSMLIDFE